MKIPVSESFFIKVEGLTPATLLKKRLQHRFFPADRAKFLITPFLQNISGTLLLLFYHKNDSVWYILHLLLISRIFFFFFLKIFKNAFLNY